MDTELIKQFAEHEARDVARFAEITESLREMVSIKNVEDAVSIAVRLTVNGKLDDIKVHLMEQDKRMKELSDKVAPIEGATTWISTLGKIILYIGALSVAVISIIKLIQIR